MNEDIKARITSARALETVKAFVLHERCVKFADDAERLSTQMRELTPHVFELLRAGDGLADLRHLADRLRDGVIALALPRDMLRGEMFNELSKRYRAGEVFPSEVLEALKIATVDDKYFPWHTPHDRRDDGLQPTKDAAA
jgi:hypothetical protein